MKRIIMAAVLLSSINLLATSPQKIICRDDQRLANGPLRELVLTSNDEGYLLQSTYIASLNAPNLEVERWAEKLTCRIDEKVPLAFCQNQSGQSIVQAKERREVFFDSLEEDAKKKTNKYIDISTHENGAENKSLSFAASHCQLIGGNT